MPEPVTTREEELTARAARGGLTLIPIPRYGEYLVIMCPDADIEICVDLDDAERDIAANE